MKFDSDIHHRRSIRLKGYDYTQAGAYFVTICTQGKECLFGKIDDGEMCKNDAGRMIQEVWDGLPQHYPGVDVDLFVVMPNHVHGIIVLVEVNSRTYAEEADRQISKNQGQAGIQEQAQGQVQGQVRGPAPTGLSLPDVVHRFKSLTTTRYRHGVHHNGWRSFLGRLWQRNYYEHIIRNEDELSKARQYIENNPLKWELDRENPKYHYR